MSDTVPYESNESRETVSVPIGLESLPWPAQFAGPMPQVYPPPPEFYTPERFPPPAPLPALAGPVAAGYAATPGAVPQQPMYSRPGRAASSVSRVEGSGQATAGLILGIVAVAASLLVPIGGVTCGIIGIVLSALGRRAPDYRTAATIGLALSIIAVILGALDWALMSYISAAQAGLFTTV